MPIEIEIEPVALTNPRWPGNDVNALSDVELNVTTDLRPGQHVELHVRETATGARLAVLTAAQGETKATFNVPNLPGKTLEFDALLCEEPSPANGHLGVIAKATSPQVTVHGFAIEISRLDEAFVPKQEALEVQLRGSDPRSLAAKGRIEVWGERYPTDLPLYTLEFGSGDGPVTWHAWTGDQIVAGGPLHTKYLTPEYSPYRMRVTTGAEDATVRDPMGAGRGKVAIAEKRFAVQVFSVWPRLQAGLPGGTQAPLDEALKIEPRNPDGTYPAQGRLPKDNETARLRIATACHNVIGQELDQGGLRVGDPYMHMAGTTKYNVDRNLHSRPEIPVEFELRLKSRDPANNTDPQKLGLHEPDALGQARFEVWVEDVYEQGRYGPATTEANRGGATAHQIYDFFADHKVKHGAHDAPQHSGGNQPIFHYWQARFVVQNDGDTDFDVHDVDATFDFVANGTEVDVYLNRARLTRDQHADYIEHNTHTIRLKRDFTKANDVLWIVRSGHNSLPEWRQGFPGKNCHHAHGGARGQLVAGKPERYLRSDYTAMVPPGREPILGSIGGQFPYHADIELKPEAQANDDVQRRVLVKARDADPQKGLAGVLFCPSYIAGDSYVIHAHLDAAPYERTFGEVSSKPAVKGKTGEVTIWRWIQIGTSLRLQDVNTGALAGTGVGSAPEPAVHTRTYHADGINMSISGMNATLEAGFNEWTAPVVFGDIHQDVNLATYRGAHNGVGWGAGRVQLNADADVKNTFAVWDHYREQLPPNIPANRLNAATAVIRAEVPAGAASQATGQHVYAKIQQWNAHFGPFGADYAFGTVIPGWPTDAGPAIPQFGGNPNQYYVACRNMWAAAWYACVDALTPPVPQPRVMNVVRWPALHDTPLWNTYDNTTGAYTYGFCRGSGQSVFRSNNPDPLHFFHEMGHSVHLIHFIAENFGWKHHDLNYPRCAMSYDYPDGYIPNPGGTVGPVGSGATPATGWPHQVPFPVPAAGGNTSIAVGVAAGDPTIHFGPLGAVNADFCAKCRLGIRGWNSEVLPCAWTHPDLY